MMQRIFILRHSSCELCQDGRVEPGLTQAPGKWSAVDPSHMASALTSGEVQASRVGRLVLWLCDQSSIIACCHRVKCVVVVVAYELNDGAKRNKGREPPRRATLDALCVE